ncbi:MAG TPA: S8 family serine peptidase, partial [Vicinamibacteria bacterium]|nr:S8 family serine peptidase [Vicinamibacteria bacterium]
GTAMLEIVHDLAPSADLYFATAFNGSPSFASNIEALQAAGCNVIIDDVTYLDEAAFQDGPIAQAVNTVTAAGVLYFSSAGNFGNYDSGSSGTWEGDFVDSGTSLSDPSRGTAAIHRFGGLNYDQLTHPTDLISLQWSDPLGTSSNDYDLFVLDSTGSNVLGYSNDSQTGSQDPLEIVYYGDPTQPYQGTLFPAGSRIVVVKYSGAARALRVDTFGAGLSIATAGSTFGHNGGEKTVTVAATHAPSSGAFVGGAANPVERYSSDGPRHIFYNADGTAVTSGNLLFATGGGKSLQKPDLTAADCVSTTLPSFTPFCGTSAAAPHAGAMAALLLSAKPTPQPPAVAASLGASALDIMSAGVDRDSGSGIPMAERAATVTDIGITMSGPAGVPTGTDATYSITLKNNGVATASSVQLLDPTPSGLVFVSNAGDCTTGFPCSLGTLTTGQSRTVAATFAVPCGYAAPSPFSNEASVDSTTPDPVSSNNSASVSTTLNGTSTLANLVIASNGPAFAIRGSDLAYTTTLANYGCGAATSVRVDNAPPAGLGFVSNSGACATAFPCAFGTLGAGAAASFTTTFAVPVGYPAPTPIVGTFTVSGVGVDASAVGHNTATVTSRFGAFFALTPCRLADTRNAVNPNGPPALEPNQQRTFVLSELCGVPAGATAVALNVTVTGGAALGDLRLFPSDVALPPASTINFAAGQTRANNALVPASADGSVSITVRNDSTGPVHLILDVTGYFE